MEPTLGLLGGGTGSGGGVAKEKMGKDNVCMSSESELELGLGLSLGGGGLVKAKGSPWGGRILTAEDFPSGFSGRGVGGGSAVGGGVTRTKRGADCFGPTEVGSTPTGVSQVVGWPPIRTYRMNTLVNQTKALNPEEDKGVGGNDGKDMNKKSHHGINKNETSPQDKGLLGFVKVNMDGLPIGRKVDLNAHTCYESLVKALEEMFFKPKAITSVSVKKERASQSLLDGSSEFVLAYEDKEGDLMLVGDVPWRMFLSTVRRLRITRTSEANGHAPRFQDGNERQKLMLYTPIRGSS